MQSNFNFSKINSLNMSIKNIKNIKNCDIQIPMQSGLYAIVGENGCGKSTILMILSRIITAYRFTTLDKNSFSDKSEIVFNTDSITEKWTYNKGWHYSTNDNKNNYLRVKGMYEGSLFYGTRFNDPSKIEDLINSGKINKKLIIDADQFVKDNLSFILHGDYEHYRNLKKLNINFKTAKEQYGLQNQPHFIENEGKLINQYRMSSGESLLISLLYFLFNSLIKNRNTSIQTLMLIDEIEVALHPKAVDRFINLLNELLENNNNLIVILTTHSTEVIRRIKHNNLMLLSDNNGQIHVEYDVYPNYAIRDIYKFSGADYLLLVEDVLSETIIKKIIRDNSLSTNKNIQVVAAGGWNTVLKLQEELYTNRSLGDTCKVFSILDGDIQDEVPKNSPTHLFLPIPSIEKFLLKKFIIKKDETFLKKISDKYFNVKSLKDIIQEYNSQNKNQSDKNGKYLYRKILDELNDRKISENDFIQNICNDIMDYVSFEKFKNDLKKLLNIT